MELWTAIATGLIGIVVPVFTLVFNQRASRRSIATLREVATDKDLSEVVTREANAALVQLIGAPKQMGRGLEILGWVYAVTGVILCIAGLLGAGGWSLGIVGFFTFGMGCFLIADVSAKRDAVSGEHDLRVKAALEGKKVEDVRKERGEGQQQVKNPRRFRLFSQEARQDGGSDTAGTSRGGATAVDPNAATPETTTTDKPAEGPEATREQVSQDRPVTGEESAQSASHEDPVAGGPVVDADVEAQRNAAGEVERS